MMTKYTMIFLVPGMVLGILVTDARRYPRSKWLWLGVRVCHC
jgi:4-amino-4-deoxy-L-arabinose transferase-like glycosyltransferase